MVPKVGRGCRLPDDCVLDHRETVSRPIDTCRNCTQAASSDTLDYLRNGGLHLVVESEDGWLGVP